MSEKTVYIGGAPEARQKIDWVRFEAQTKVAVTPPAVEPLTNKGTPLALRP